jgi:hypothetical protein
MGTTTQVSKWGNSLALRLPKSVARDIGVVLADHVGNLDWLARRVEFAATAPVEALIDVRERLRVLLGL